MLYVIRPFSVFSKNGHFWFNHFHRLKNCFFQCHSHIWEQTEALCSESWQIWRTFKRRTQQCPQQLKLKGKQKIRSETTSSANLAPCGCTVGNEHSLYTITTPHMITRQKYYFVREMVIFFNIQVTLNGSTIISWYTKINEDLDYIPWFSSSLLDRTYHSSHSFRSGRTTANCI